MGYACRLTLRLLMASLGLEEEGRLEEDVELCAIEQGEERKRRRDSLLSFLDRHHPDNATQDEGDSGGEVAKQRRSSLLSGGNGGALEGGATGMTKRMMHRLSQVVRSPSPSLSQSTSPVSGVGRSSLDSSMRERASPISASRRGSFTPDFIPSSPRSPVFSFSDTMQPRSPRGKGMTKAMACMERDGSKDLLSPLLGKLFSLKTNFNASETRMVMEMDEEETEAETAVGLGMRDEKSSYDGLPRLISSLRPSTMPMTNELNVDTIKDQEGLTMINPYVTLLERCFSLCKALNILPGGVKEITDLGIGWAYEVMRRWEARSGEGGWVRLDKFVERVKIEMGRSEEVKTWLKERRRRLDKGIQGIHPPGPRDDLMRRRQVRKGQKCQLMLDGHFGVLSAHGSLDVRVKRREVVGEENRLRVRRKHRTIVMSRPLAGKKRVVSMEKMQIKDPIQEGKTPKEKEHEEKEGWISPLPVLPSLSLPSRLPLDRKQTLSVNDKPEAPRVLSSIPMVKSMSDQSLRDSLKKFDEVEEYEEDSYTQSETKIVKGHVMEEEEEGGWSVVEVGPTARCNVGREEKEVTQELKGDMSEEEEEEEETNEDNPPVITSYPPPELTILTVRCCHVHLIELIHGTLYLTTDSLYFRPDPQGNVKRGPLIIPLSHLCEVHLRRYLLRKTALELLILPSKKCFLFHFPDPRHRSMMYGGIMDLKRSVCPRLSPLAVIPWSSVGREMGPAEFGSQGLVGSVMVGPVDGEEDPNVSLPSSQPPDTPSVRAFPRSSSTQLSSPLSSQTTLAPRGLARSPSQGSLGSIGGGGRSRSTGATMPLGAIPSPSTPIATSSGLLPGVFGEKGLPTSSPSSPSLSPIQGPGAPRINQGSGGSPSVLESVGTGLVASYIRASPNELFRRSGLTSRWQKGEISNFAYLMGLNSLAGRTYADLAQYPVFPWVLSDYSSQTLDLRDPRVYRDLSRPMGALGAARLHGLKERYKEMEAAADGMDSSSPPPFLYGAHYSSAAGVVFFLMRMEPYTSVHLSLQGGRFDHADRLFTSIAESWDSCSGVTGNGGDVKELIPEFYSSSAFLMNSSNLPLGHRQDGQPVHHVILPPWASDPESFIRANRAALESPYVSAHLHHWIGRWMRQEGLE